MSPTLSPASAGTDPASTSETSIGYPTDHPPTTVKLRGALVPGRACRPRVKAYENTGIYIRWDLPVQHGEFLENLF